MKASLVASAMFAALLAAGSASAESTITFTGSVTDRTCSFTGGNGTSGGTNGNFTVPLSPVSAAEIDGAPARTFGAKGFAINITGGGTATCADGTPAKMSWNALQATIDQANGTLRNTLTGATAATNVGIGLFNVNGSRIDLRNTDDANNPTVNVSGSSAQLQYVAKYVGFGGSVTAGAVQSALEYVVSFN
ncbi:fimbrial protein [Variovorax sp. YR216]|uniref:fimbrial protein n=1 Tax=Variovorax sp. YR216 TaxID=1882828 RepID=UPI000898DB12|nr:fimbrial protein [Variovorax sp. YR216]SEB21206.1 major type 1 subunit fimbrin (pilin) [Variovorax sp. YR216]